MTISSIVLGALLFAQPLPDEPPPAEAPVVEETTPVVAETAPDAPAAAVAPAAPEARTAFDLNQLKMTQCQGERFEFKASEATKVKLCSNAGASKEEVAAMLQSAIAQLEATDRLRAESRDVIVAQIRAKLAEVQAR